VTSVWSVIHGLKPEWENQLNINTWLLMKNGWNVQQHQIVALLRDWSKYKAHEPNYPSCQVAIVPAPMWSWEQANQYIEGRVALHQSVVNVSDDDLPECTPEEMWEEPTKFAVMKKGRKSAVRLLESQEAAEKYIENNQLDSKHSIEVRPGSRKRCDDYCSVNTFCSQFKEYRRA
jgi:hypothetical protein